MGAAHLELGMGQESPAAPRPPGPALHLCLHAPAHRLGLGEVGRRAGGDSECPACPPGLLSGVGPGLTGGRGHSRTLPLPPAQVQELVVEEDACVRRVHHRAEAVGRTQSLGWGARTAFGEPPHLSGCPPACWSPILSRAAPPALHSCPRQGAFLGEARPRVRRAQGHPPAALSGRGVGSLGPLLTRETGRGSQAPPRGDKPGRPGLVGHVEK